MSETRARDREPRFARVKWFTENYGLSRYMLLRMVERDGVSALRTDDAQSGVILFNVRDVKDALTRRMGRVKATRLSRRAPRNNKDSRRAL